jgi:hypothetical protein
LVAKAQESCELAKAYAPVVIDEDKIFAAAEVDN